MPSVQTQSRKHHIQYIFLLGAIILLWGNR